MEFRWIVFLTLWTVLSGPMLVRPSLGDSGPQPQKRAVVQKARPHVERPAE